MHIGRLKSSSHRPYSLPHAIAKLKQPGTMARVYADVNQHMPKSYWEYDSVNITWGVLENYEVVRKIGMRSAQVAWIRR